MPEHALVLRALDELVASAREALGDDLRSVVLFGSAAEGRLRASSDVNVIFVLRRFDAERAARLGDALRLAHAAVRLEPMFLAEGEIQDAAHEFAVKFADVARRRKVLHGDDPFASLAIPRDVELRRLRQILLNLVLRLRERAVMAPDSAVADVLADAAGPLRAAAVSLLVLAGEPALAPRDALAKLAPALCGPSIGDALATMSAARDAAPVEPEHARAALLELVRLAAAMRARAAAAEGTGS